MVWFEKSPTEKLHVFLLNVIIMTLSRKTFAV